MLDCTFRVLELCLTLNVLFIAGTSRLTKSASLLYPEWTLVTDWTEEMNFLKRHPCSHLKYTFMLLGKMFFEKFKTIGLCYMVPLFFSLLFPPHSKPETLATKKQYHLSKWRPSGSKHWETQLNGRKTTLTRQTTKWRDSTKPSGTIGRAVT